MYAVISTGGKQYRVEEGQSLQVERISSTDADGGSEVSFSPVLLVDGDTVLATPDQLSGASVSAKVVGESRGPKINAFTYKSKANQRKRWGHRQTLATIDITRISR